MVSGMALGVDSSSWGQRWFAQGLSFTRCYRKLRLPNFTKPLTSYGCQCVSNRDTLPFVIQTSYVGRAMHVIWR